MFVGNPGSGNSRVDTVLTGIIGDRLYAVTFAENRVVLHFDDHALHAETPLTVLREGAEVHASEQPFKNALCEQIAKYVSAYRLDPRYLAIVFGNAEVQLSLATEDFVGPEAGRFVSARGELSFRIDKIFLKPPVPK